MADETARPAQILRVALLLGLLALAACATPQDPAPVNCDAVRCAGCPEGQTPALKPPDCCKCVATQ